MAKYVLPVSHSGLHNGTFNYTHANGPAIIYLADTSGTWTDDDITASIFTSVKVLLVYNQGYRSTANNNAIVYLDLFFKRALNSVFSSFTYENDFFKFEGINMHVIGYDTSLTKWNSLYTSTSMTLNNPKQLFHLYAGNYITLKKPHTIVWEDCATTNGVDVVVHYSNGIEELYPTNVKVNTSFTLKSNASGQLYNWVDSAPKKILKYIVFEI
jgi:hypothetical protein